LRIDDAAGPTRFPRPNIMRKPPMRSDVARQGRSVRHAGANKVRPRLESLEGRLLLYSTSGNAWSHPERVTFSFMPDGTNIGGGFALSALYQTLNASFPTATWQDQFRKAAAVWQQVANVNLVQVADDGTDMGAPGNQQSDPRFGDIRIGGMPQPMGILAEAFFPPPNQGGTLAGDILFNTSQPWQSNSGYDLESVAIHELGHALGMSHSAITSADMYAYYTGVNQWADPDDVAGMQSIYGARPDDPFVNTRGFAGFAAAPDISSRIWYGQFVIPGLDIASYATADVFRVTAPATTTSTLTVTMQSTGLSEVSPRVQVYVANGTGYRSIGLQQAPTSFGATVSVTIPNVVPGQVYYIKTTSANGLVQAGNYGLLVNFGPYYQSPIPPPNTVVAQQPDGSGGPNHESVGGSGDTGSWNAWAGGGGAGDPSSWNAWAGGGGWGGQTVTGLRPAHNDGAGDRGQMIRIGSIVGMGDTLEIAAPKTNSGGGNGPLDRGAVGDFATSSVAVTATATVGSVDSNLLVAPTVATATHDAALDGLDPIGHGGNTGRSRRGPDLLA